MQQQPSIARGPDDEMPGFGDYVGIVRKRKRLLFMVGLPILALGGAARARPAGHLHARSGLIEIEGAENVRRTPQAARCRTRSHASRTSRCTPISTCRA